MNIKNTTSHRGKCTYYVTTPTKDAYSSEWEQNIGVVGSVVGTTL